MRWRTSLIAPLLVCSLLAVALSACSGTSSQQKITLKMVSWQGTDAAQAYKDLNERFHAANPNITVDYEVIPANTYQNVLQSRFAGGNPPDIIMVFGGGNFKDAFARAGDLVDLTGEPWASRLTPYGLTDAKLKPDANGVADTSGKLYSLPSAQNVMAVTYNKDIFSRLGLSVPTTWADFLSVCEKIKAAGIIPITLGTKDSWPITYAWTPFQTNSVYLTNPNFGLDAAAGKAKYADSAEWKQALGDFAALYQRGYVDKNNTGTDFAAVTNLIGLGKAAMTISGDFTLANILGPNPDAKVALFPLPYGPAGKSSVIPTFTDTEYTLAAKGKHVEAAKQYLRFVAQSDQVTQFVKAKKALPLVTDVSAQQIDPAQELTFVAVQKNPATLPADNTVSTKAANALSQGLSGILSGTTTPEQVLQQMDDANKK